MGEAASMRKDIHLIRENDAQVLGLPMYLIIVMIVAVAVIAAVIFMIPQGTGLMNAQVIENAVIAEDPGNAGIYTFSSNYNVEVKVTTNDDKTSPIAGATVTLVGSGDAASATTNSEGIATLSVTPTLNENSNEAFMELTVKAAGYQQYTDQQAVTIYRLQ